MRAVRLNASLVALVAAVEACSLFGPSEGAQYGAWVDNQAPRDYVVSFAGDSQSYSPTYVVPARSTVGTIYAPGSWRGRVVVLSLDCRKVAELTLSLGQARIVISADGSVTAAEGVFPGVPLLDLEPKDACGRTNVRASP